MKKFYSKFLLLAAVVFAIGANSQTVFTYTGTFDSYVVPAGVTSIGIEALGAQGASADPSFVGGNGAKMYGEFSVTAGQTLIIVVGGEGVEDGCNGGGGGGTFVVLEDPGSGNTITSGPYSGTDVTPLIIAGGGSGTRTSVSQNGNPGVTTLGATTGSGSSMTGGGLPSSATPGYGGIVSSGSWGSGAGGFIGNGSPDGSAAYAGKSFLNGASGGVGSASGGFGGGGAGNGSCGGGGGGGYTGGDGGRVAGGGGSYNDGANQDNANGFNSGAGQVTITVLCTALSTTVSADTVCVGEEVILHAESTIGGTVTWDGGISDSVAFTIDSAGVTTYTANSDTTDCAFVVDILVEPAPEFSLSSTDELSGADGNAYITITDGIFPFTFDWDNDGTGDFDDDQNQTGLTAGWYTVTVMHGNGCTSVDSVQVNSQLSIKELGENVVLYPNPAADHIIIEGMDSFTYAIADAQGKIVLNGEGGENENISLKELESGVYIINLTYQGISQTVRLIKE